MSPVVALAILAALVAFSVVIGAVVWAVFAFWAHGYLFGVRPFG